MHTLIGNDAPTLILNVRQHPVTLGAGLAAANGQAGTAGIGPNGRQP